MTLTAGTINLPIKPDLSAFGSSLTSQTSSLFRTSAGKMSGLAKTLLAVPIVGAIGAGIAQGVTAVSGWMKQAEEAAAVAEELGNTLHTMGNVAGVTAKELLDMNQATGLQVGIDDDLITAGTNLLVTFGHIRDEQGKGNDIMTQANALMVDYAAKFTDGNFTSAATQLGKALENPVAGMSALARVGVTFTDKQQKVIEKLVESNHLLEAQKLILKAITPQVKGTAAAQTTASEKMANAWSEFTELLGGVAAKYINPLLNDLTRFFSSIVKHTNGIGDVWEKVLKNLGPLWDKWAPVLQQKLAQFFSWVAVALRNAITDAILVQDDVIAGMVAAAVGVAVDNTSFSGGGNVGGGNSGGGSSGSSGGSGGAGGHGGRSRSTNVRVTNSDDFGDGGASQSHMERAGRMHR